MIEVEVHQQLRAFLREQGEPDWPHHLTMARLVARALRLGRSALIQAGAPSGHHGRYRLSYLMPLLLWQESAILVAPEPVLQRLLMVELPRLRQWITTDKPVQMADCWREPGLLLTTPQVWLADRLDPQGRFPQGILTVIDGADQLEDWTRQQLTLTLESQDWDQLMQQFPQQADLIRDQRVQLTRTIFQHPANPYERYLLEASDRAALSQMMAQIAQPDCPPIWSPVWQQLQERLLDEQQICWAEVVRSQGQFCLHLAPAEVAARLQAVWQQQPVVLIGGALDLEADAAIFKQRLGLEDLTCIKFSLHRQHELVQLYLPDGLPMPNTPQFQPMLIQEIRALLTASQTANQGLTVLLVGDLPLKAQVGSVLAGELGSRVQVEKTCLEETSILVTGWEFWRDHQAVLPAPHLLVIATLPLPSLEDPLVAGRVAVYKRSRQDWFRLYLLPQALAELQRAVAPVRGHGVVALLDNRVNHRTYGQQVLTALSPLARINYLDASLFTQFEVTQFEGLMPED
ncbi:MAG: ATP-dependent DNA helicase [Pegethrix bostrychoides GSE-TBD4-15B]|uniref:ATP-dependent DNA helicase n=1 Tax=Pegethrix bostrychoides GSE-TBD4-15B TaxID=2839662 RepID=A0A951PCB6_9CYAN|nr:ATP-dependent DNA helicase [Pegethrix bostrychoides GSE-TBD4-15B]